MSTRFYLPASGFSDPSGLTPSQSASWDVASGSPTRRQMPRYKSTTAFADTTKTETSTSAQNISTDVQFISEPLEAGQYILGPISIATRAGESNTAADVSLNYTIRVMNAAGTIVATLRDAHTLAVASAPGTELVATTSNSKAFSLTSNGGVAYLTQAGDRIVFEPGFRFSNVSATSYSAFWRFGTDPNNPDISTSSQSQEYNPTLEFPEDLRFLTGITRFYLQGATSPVASSVLPTAGSLWNVLPVSYGTEMDPSRRGAATGTVNTPAETSASVQNVMSRQYVSGALKAQTISGFATLAIRCAESSTAADMSLQMVVRVVNSSGVEQAVLYAGHSAANQAALGGDHAHGFLGDEMTTSTGFQMIKVPISSYACSLNDRLVCEIGVRAANAVTTSYTANFTYRDDFGRDEFGRESFLWPDSNEINANPWFGIEQNLDFVYTQSQVAGMGLEVLETMTRPDIQVAGLGLEVLITRTASVEVWGAEM